MKSRAIKIEAASSLVWTVFLKNNHLLTRTNYGALNVESILNRIYDY